MEKQHFFHFHDHGYKYLFSNPTMVKYLITSFVKEDWVKKVDFTKIEKLDKEFIDEEFAKRASDIVYKINYKGKEAYLFLLIEFQSTVDPFMGLRILHYVTKFYLDIIERKDYKLLPPVFPLMLYNGDEKWTAPLEFRELIEDGGEGIEAYIPRFRYYKIAENEFPKETLFKLNNLVSGLFYLEKSSVSELEQALDLIVELISKEKDKTAVNRFTNWIKNFLKRRQPKEDKEENRYNFTNPREVRNMLATTLEEIEQEGEKKGEKKGIVESVKVYLLVRFSQAPEEILIKLKEVDDVEELERLAAQVYRCQNLDEIVRLV
ncbi:MAG: Rpn family recombination-promoting nuclease/putative transposase [bacterium]